jgi:hypothetical protein
MMGRRGDKRPTKGKKVNVEFEDIIHNLEPRPSFTLYCKIFLVDNNIINYLSNEVGKWGRVTHNIEP